MTNLKGLLLSIVLGLSVAQHSSRPQLNVEFEYQLEVLDTAKTGSTSDALKTIDDLILEKLQAKVPELNKNGNHLLEFHNITSQIFSACFTSSDQCSHVRSSVEVRYEDAKPQHSVEFVTLHLVQGYLEEISRVNNEIVATYAYPTMVSSLAKFEMDSVWRRMFVSEVTILSDTFMEVFGAIIFAMEGDTFVRDAQFLYQDLVGNAEAATVLSASMRVSGYCRDCTSKDFERIMVRVIESNLPAFQNRLKANSKNKGSVFFNEINSIAFSVPQLPIPLAPLEESSIFDTEVPRVDSKQPWFLWFGICVASILVCVGCFLVVQDSMVIVEKDEYSTGESSAEVGASRSEDVDMEGGKFEEGIAHGVY